MRTVIPLLLLAQLGVAAPVPKPSMKEQIEKQYGKIVDPKGDSTFTLDRGRLAVTLPANKSRCFGFQADPQDPLNPETFKKTTTAPRVEIPAEGDFVITVRVMLTINPTAGSITGGSEVFVGGGVQVLLAPDDWYYLGPVEGSTKYVFGRDLSYEDPRVFSNGPGVGVGPRTIPPNPAWVRVERIGQELRLANSSDGTEYRVNSSYKNAKLPKTVTLALTAHHSSDKAHTVVFDEFKLEVAKKEVPRPGGAR